MIRYFISSFCLLVISSISLAAGDKWVEKADMMTAIDSLSTSVVNGKIYAIGGWTGGMDANAKFTKTVGEYDPIKNIWTKKADMPTARGASTCVVDGKIYAIGGYGNGVVAVPSIEVYDPATDKWTKKDDMPTLINSFSISSVNGKIYIIGGCNVNNGLGPSLSTVEEYDPMNDKWTRKADIPTSRMGLSTCVVNGKIYAIGGQSEAAIVWNVLSTVEVYDPARDTWTKKADMPTARVMLSTEVVNDDIYAMGGALSFVNALSTVEVYDSATDTWTKKSDMPTARRALSASVVNGKVYAIGGSSAANIPLATVEEYTPEGWPFAVSPEGRLASKWGEIKSKQ